MAGTKDMDLDPGYTFLVTYMWRNGVTELDFAQSEVIAAFDSIVGMSLLIVPTDRGHKIMIGTREQAELMSQGLNVETGAVDPGATLN